MTSHYISCRALAVLVSLLLFLSCKKEHAPQTPSEQSPFADAGSATEAVQRLYREGLPSLYLDTDPEEGVRSAWPAYLSGLIESEALAGPYPALNAAKLSSPAVQRLAETIYSRCYDGIELADSLLRLLPTTKGLLAGEQAQLLGEARFFRAFNRFYLLRSFGVTQERRGGQAKSLEEGYQLIEQDLRSAIALLPSRTKEVGSYRVHQDLARVLLGEVYLQMSGYPLRQAKYKEAVAILRPILSSGKYRLMPNGGSEEHSAFNTLRTAPTCDEYLFTLRGVRAPSLEAYTFPREAKSWGKVGELLAFNAFRPTKLFMSVYNEGDLRGKDRQYFHSFYKVAEEGKTVFQIFDPAPWFWLRSTPEHIGTRPMELGLYPYSEVLLLLAEALLESEEEVSTAIRCLAEVRGRALQQAPSEVALALASLSKEELQAELWLERLRELPFQMKQLWDIQRTRKYPKEQGGRLRLIPLEQAVTPQGHKLSPQGLVLPLPSL
jgi:hypothetical protein|nr:RagB/SusD family nutrient uptake outer membrane protein [uncultured Porphyromonas sp.]